MEAKVEIGSFQDAGSLFMQSLFRMDQTIQQLVNTMNQKADKSELDELAKEVAKTSAGQLNEAIKAMQDKLTLIEEMNVRLHQTTSKTDQAFEELRSNHNYVKQIEVEITQSLAEKDKLFGVLEENCQVKIDQMEEASVETKDKMEKATEKAIQELGGIMNAKANKQDIRRLSKVTTMNLFRIGPKVFQQSTSSVVNDYRASMVMDIGYKYRLAVQIRDHNRQFGEYIEGAVALLPEIGSAWMNCDWGVGRGWARDGSHPGVGLMNLHGSSKSGILVSGDILDISLDHHTGKHVVEFRKRGSTDVFCRRDVVAEPLNLVVSLWGKAGVELIEFEVVDA
jgi:hypothetical protein